MIIDLVTRQSSALKMAAKTLWRRYGAKLHYCCPVYTGLDQASQIVLGILQNIV